MESLGPAKDLGGRGRATDEHGAAEEGDPVAGLQRAARSCALRLGLSRETADDCAIELLERLDRKGLLTDMRARPQRYCAAWRRRCAANAAKNAHRRCARLRAREILWTELTSGDAPNSGLDVPDPAPSQDALLLRRELCRRVLAAADQLNATQRQLFEGYFLRGESADELAISQQRTPHAIREALVVIRRRLRAVLRRRGLDEAELRDYLAAFSR